jgi:hypothetical protein
MARNPLRDWKAGQVIPEDRLNDIHAWIKSLKFSGSAPVIVRHDATGVHISLGHMPTFDLVQLDEDIEAGDIQKKAAILTRDYDASLGDDEQTKLAYGPLLEHTMDPWRSVWLEEHRGVTFWSPNFGQRFLLPGFNFHIVELTGSLSSGGSASAKILTPVSGSLADTTGPLLITVNDIGTGATTPSGTKCFVNQHQVGGKWWVVPAVSGTGGTGTIKYCYFTADAAFTRDDETFDGTVVRAWGDGTLPTGTIELVNPPSATSLKFWWAAASGQMGRAIWNEQDETWEVDHMEPVLISPVENVDWTSPNLTQDKQDIWTHFVENPDTTNILEGTTNCPEP